MAPAAMCLNTQDQPWAAPILEFSNADAGSRIFIALQTAISEEALIHWIPEASIFRAHHKKTPA